MKRYLLTSGKFEGQAVVRYSHNGVLISVDVEGADMSHNQIEWLLRNIPMYEHDLTHFIGRFQGAKLEYVEEAIRFEDFWNKYNDKERSSKKRTEAKWIKMSEGEQRKAFNYLPKYIRSIPGGIAKKHAETYLNAEMWNN